MAHSTNRRPVQGSSPMLVALTGGVASGKTAVSDRLARKGVPVVDTDRIAREVVAPDTPGLEAVTDAFGADILDASGSLDRRALRTRIFEEPEARSRLEAILHPLIAREARRRVEAETQADYVVLVVPLLVESGLFDDAERVIVVDVDERVQIDRLTRRDGVSEAQARAMLDAQASREERLAVATDVIENSGDLSTLDTAVDTLHRKLTALSRRRADSPRAP